MKASWILGLTCAAAASAPELSAQNRGEMPASISRSTAEARLGALFVEIDTNRDGRLSRQELFRAHRGGARDEYRLPGLDTRTLARFDSDSDGFVTREEALRGSRRSFSRIDADQDSSVTYAERQQAQEDAYFGICRAKTAACRASEIAAERRRASFQENGVGLERFDWSSRASFRFNSGLDEPRFEVVRDPATWETLWQQVTARQGSGPMLPLVDFKQEMILVAAMGRRRSGGYSIQIVSVLPKGPDLVATVVRTSPGPRCGTTQAITNPSDMVKVAATSKRIRWAVNDRVSHCP